MDIHTIQWAAWRWLWATKRIPGLSPVKRCTDLTTERAFLKIEWLLCSAHWHDEQTIIWNVLVEQMRDPFKHCPEESWTWEHRQPYDTSSMCGWFHSKCLTLWKNYTCLKLVSFRVSSSSSTGTTVGHKPWPPILVPCTGLKPGTFASNFQPPLPSYLLPLNPSI